MFFAKNDNYILRKIHDTYLFINITDNYKDDKCNIIETNEIGAFIWNHLEGKKSSDDLAKLLFEMIVDEVPYDEIYNDVKYYLDSLMRKQVVYGKE